MIKLRPFRESDLETYRGWVNDPEIMRLAGRDRPVTEAEHKVWYCKLITDLNAAVFAIDVDGGYIGNVWLWNIDSLHQKAEVRIIIGKRHGLGYGTEALELISFHAFKDLDLNRLYAYVFSYNKRAKGAFEQAGFKKEGLLKSDRIIGGKYVDTFIMARING